MRKIIKFLCISIFTFMVLQLISFYAMWAIGFGWLYTGTESALPVTFAVMGWVCLTVITFVNIFCCEKKTSFRDRI